MFHPGDIWEMDMKDFLFWAKGIKTISKFMGNS
jgi:hypothetical protein